MKMKSIPIVSSFSHSLDARRTRGIREKPRRRSGFGRALRAPRALELEGARREGVPHELCAARELQLLHDAGTMRLGRPDGDEEQLRDLLIRMPEREEPQHLVFALR